MTDAVQPRVKALSITLERCAKTFPDGTCALQPLDLHIEAGETVVLLGPSGCGKTTTLRMIAGLESPDAGGRVLFDGVDVTAQPIEQRNVGMVFQSYALFPNMSVAEKERGADRPGELAGIVLPSHLHVFRPEQDFTGIGRQHVGGQLAGRATEDLVDDAPAQAVHGADEAGDEGRRRLVVNLPRLADLRDAAMVHDDDAVAEGHRFGLIVRDVDGGDAEAGQ